MALPVRSQPALSSTQLHLSPSGTGKRTNGKGSPIRRGLGHPIQVRVSDSAADRRRSPQRRAAAAHSGRPGAAPLSAAARGVGVRYCAGVPGSAPPHTHPPEPRSARVRRARKCPERAVPLALCSARRTEVAVEAGESRREMPLPSPARRGRRVETVRASGSFFSTRGVGRLVETRVGLTREAGRRRVLRQVVSTVALGEGRGSWSGSGSGSGSGGRTGPRLPAGVSAPGLVFSCCSNGGPELKAREQPEGDAGCWVRSCTNNPSHARASPEP